MNRQREISKLEAELDFTIEKMRPLLEAASQTAHKLEIAKAAEQDPECAQFDRLLDLGHLVDGAGGMCGPHVGVLVRVMFTLMGGEQDDVAELSQLQH